MSQTDGFNKPFVQFKWITSHIKRILQNQFTQKWSSDIYLTTHQQQRDKCTGYLNMILVTKIPFKSVL